MRFAAGPLTHPSGMCLCIVLRSLHADFPILVAANRDERPDRKASPPGLWVGLRRRVISPRDRLAGGTWLGVNDRGMFAGLTNVSQSPPLPAAPSRGHLPHLALDEDDLDAATAVVLARVRQTPHAGFQLVLCDGRRTRVLRHAGDELAVIDWPEPVLVISNEHAPGELRLPALAAAAAPRRSADQQLDALQPLLLDGGGGVRHPALKRGTSFATVSSSLLAVPVRDPLQLVWRFCQGSPDKAPYRDYGNLGRRLLPDGEPMQPDRPRE